MGFRQVGAHVDFRVGPLDGSGLLELPLFQVWCPGEFWAWPPLFVSETQNADDFDLVEVVFSVVELEFSGFEVENEVSKFDIYDFPFADFKVWLATVGLGKWSLAK